MNDWQTQFEAMRQAFRERARPRLQRTAELLQALENGTQNEETLHLLFKDMHWLAGVGGTYKLPELTGIGDTGERICDKCLTDGQALTVEELGKLRALVNKAAEVLASPL